MERADLVGQDSGKDQHHRFSQHTQSRTALILYGSETGNAQDVAEEIGRLTERLHFDAVVLDLDSVQLRDLLLPTLVIFVVSTTGQGEFPQNARTFWKALLSSALQPGVLRKLHFTTFGLGDSSYAQFNVAHRMLHGRLVQLGANSLCDRGEGNEQHPEGHSAGLRAWTLMLQQQMIEKFPLPDGLDPLAEDLFIQPKWMLETVAESVNHFEASHSDGTGSRGQPISASTELPSSNLLPVVNAHTARIVRNDRVTIADHFQDVRLLDLRTEGFVDYGPGAVAIVYPKNFPEDVQQFIELMSWEDIADTPLKPVCKADRHGAFPSPSPLRHLRIVKPLSIRWLLENVLDIMSIPRRSFFASLAHFAGTDTADESYQKERLLELANPELIDELWDYTTRPKRTILEVMMDFTTIKIPWQYALTVLPIMRGRQFSIASGGALERDHDGNTRVQLLVAIADPPSPIIKWRRRYGVCTRYIATLQEGAQINIGIHQGYLNVRPQELRVPVILIGPGTGVAPLRSMIYQRTVWNAELSLRETGCSLAGDILFFGCRSERADYFFRDEWDDFTDKEGLSVFTAFSRDNHKPRQYVQDLIRVHGDAVYDALIRKKGKVYICGSSGNMPKGVRQGLLDVLVHSGGMSTHDAEETLQVMEKDGRYKQETW